MSWRHLALSAIAMLTVALVALMPMRFAHIMSGEALGEGISTYGRIWDGRLYNVAVGRARFERIDGGLRPLSLLTGQAVFDWTLADPEARGEGEAFAGFSEHGVRNASLTTTLRGLGLPMAALDPAEAVSLDIEQLTFSANGCRDASGTLRTAALVGFAAPYDVRAPMLEGPLGCNQGNLVVDLSGETPDMALTLTVSLSPSGLYRWAAEARLPNQSLTPVFSASGFTQDGDIWHARGEGQL